MDDLDLSVVGVAGDAIFGIGAVCGGGACDIEVVGALGTAAAAFLAATALSIFAQVEVSEVFARPASVRRLLSDAKPTAST